MADHAAWNPPRPLAANVKAIETHLTIRPVRTDMETHLVRRPVYGGPGRMKLKKLPRNAILRGVQGSCGPLVGGRRIETAGPLVLSVTKEQR